MDFHRRDWLRLAGAGLLAGGSSILGQSEARLDRERPLDDHRLIGDSDRFARPALAGRQRLPRSVFPPQCDRVADRGWDRRPGRDAGRRGRDDGPSEGEGPGGRPECLRLPEVLPAIAGARNGDLRGDRDGLPRRLRSRDRSPSLRDDRRPGSRVGRIRRLPVLPLRRRSSGDPGGFRTSPIREAEAIARSTPGERSVRRRRWPRWPHGSAIDGGFAFSSSRAASSLPRWNAIRSSPCPNGLDPRPGCGSIRTAAGRHRRRSASARRSGTCRWNTTRTRCKARRRWPRSGLRPD